MTAVFIVVGVIGPLALLALSWWATARWYVKATPNMAFVRTGLFGRRVVVDGGAFVLPVVQSIRWISLETMRFEVLRANRDAFITRDRLRVDVGAEFYMKVEADPARIERASRSLGERSLNPDSIRELVQDKLVSALRSAAATRELMELHENRAAFARAVQESLVEDLALNGLTLESVAVSALDQTARDQLDPSNIFDAEGLRQITQVTSARLKERNDIERDTEVAMKQKDVEATKLKLALEREHEFALAENRHQVEARKVEETQALARLRIAEELSTRKTEIERERQVKESEIEREGQIIKRQEARERIEVERERGVALARIDKEAELARKERERLELETARARAAEEVVSAAARAGAEREDDVARIRAHQALVVAEIEAKAAAERAKGVVATGEAQARARLKAVEAENATETRIVERELLLRLIERAPEIVDKLMEPARRIESIRVLNLAGLNGPGSAPGGDGAGAAGGLGGGAFSTILSSIVGAGAAFPLVKELLSLYQGEAQKAVQGLKEKGPRLSAVASRESAP